MKNSRIRRTRQQFNQAAEHLEAKRLLDASGIFAEASQFELLNGSGRLSLVDTNRDGDLDVVLINGSTSRVYANDGVGNFEPVNSTFGPTQTNGTEVIDVDGDGFSDLVIATSPSGAPGLVSVWRNRGNHSFELVSQSQVTAQTMDAVDVDRDGDLDIVVGGNPVVLFKNDGLGNLTPTPLSAPVELGFNCPAVVADVNKDGAPDILAGRFMALNDGAGNFPSFTPSGVGVNFGATSVADFDGDGDVDIYESINTSPDGTSRIYFNDGTGQFAPSAQVLGRLSDTADDLGTVAGDIDGDGDWDLVVHHGYFNNEIPQGNTVWINDGTGNFTGRKGPFTLPDNIVLGDVDGDGDLDFLGVDDYLHVALNRTVTTVQLPVAGGNFEAIRSGDDLVVRQVGGEEIFRDAAAGIRTLRILGSAANDRVDASSLTGIRLVMIGGDGNDTLIGGSEADTLDGGAGNDSILGNGGADLISGGAGNDWLGGNMGNDSLDGGDDADTLIGGGGRDQLRGGNGNDALNGGSGNDRMYGEAGSDVLRADSGNDLLDGGTEADTLVGDAGNDSLLGGDGDDLLRGVAGRDTLDGGTGNDDLRGGADNDSLVGGLGNDTLNGNIGHDKMFGGDGDDALSGGFGNDLLNGADGQDALLGGFGHDTLLGGADSDILLAHDGNDSLDGGDNTDTLNGGTGLNTVIDPESEIDLAFTLTPNWDGRS